MIRAPKILIELRSSSVHGVGVFAVPAIKKHTKLADGTTEEDYRDFLTWEQLESFDMDVRKKVMDFCVGRPNGFIPPTDFDFNKLSVEWYVNHSCDGNCGFNDDGEFIAIKRIESGEELTFDYGLVESNPKFEMTCRCGSTKCRKKITGNDWLDKGFRAKNLKYMLPRLRVLPL